MLVIIGLRLEFRPLILLQSLGHSGFSRIKYLAAPTKKDLRNGRCFGDQKLEVFFFLPFKRSVLADRRLVGKSEWMALDITKASCPSG